MQTVTPLVGVGLGAMGALAPLLGPLLPRLGPTLFYRLGRLRSVLAVAAVALTLAAYGRRPSRGRLAGVAAAALLGAVSPLLHPRWVFVALDRPPHVAAGEATLGDEALVLGVEVEDTACAWALEMVIPHHLVNDQAGRAPVLVSY